MLPKFLNLAKAGNQEKFHSAAQQLIRIQPFQSSLNNDNSSSSPMSKVQAIEVVQKLTENERESLREALSQFELDKFKNKIEGKNVLFHLLVQKAFILLIIYLVTSSRAHKKY